MELSKNDKNNILSQLKEVFLQKEGVSGFFKVTTQQSRLKGKVKEICEFDIKDFSVNIKDLKSRRLELSE